MIHFFSNRADIVAVEDNFAFQLVPIHLNMVMLHHNYNHIYLIEELVEIENLVRHNLLVGEEGVEALQRTSQVALLDIDHLERGALAHVIDILLIGDAIETHTAVVGDMMGFHNLMDAL